MNPHGYWVPGVPKPITEETERNAMNEPGFHPAGRPPGGDTVKWIGRSTLVVISTIAIVATGAAMAQAACPVVDTVRGIEPPVDDVLEPLDEVVDPVVDTIFGTVDDVIGGGGGEEPGPPGGTGHGGGGQPGVHRGGPEPSGRLGRGTVDIAGPRAHERPELGRVFVPVVAPRPIADRLSPRFWEIAVIQEGV